MCDYFITKGESLLEFNFKGQKMKLTNNDIDFMRLAKANNNIHNGKLWLLGSQWVSGSGRYTRTRAIPKNVNVIDLQSEAKAGQTRLYNMIVKQHHRAKYAYFIDLMKIKSAMSEKTFDFFTNQKGAYISKNGNMCYGCGQIAHLEFN